jgi:hypothetical protein
MWARCHTWILLGLKHTDTSKQSFNYAFAARASRLNQKEQLQTKKCPGSQVVTAAAWSRSLDSTGSCSPSGGMSSNLILGAIFSVSSLYIIYHRVQLDSLDSRVSDSKYQVRRMFPNDTRYCTTAAQLDLL